VKDGAIVERRSVLGNMADRILPILGAGGQANEVGHPDRCFVGKTVCRSFANGGVDEGGGLSGCSMVERPFWIPPRAWLRASSGLRLPEPRRRANRAKARSDVRVSCA